MAEIITIPENAIVYDINLEMHKQDHLDDVYTKQYDTNTRFIRATVWNDGVIHPITADKTITFSCTKPDRYGIDNPAGIDSEGRIVYLITDNTSASHGNFKAEFRIYSSEVVGETTITKRETTYDFNMHVAKSALDDATVISSNEFNILTQNIGILGDLIADANEVIPIMNQAAIDEAQRVINENERIAKEEARPDYVTLTQAQYDDLTQAQKDDPLVYYEITDDDGLFPSELQALIDNTNAAKTAAESLLINRAGINDVEATPSEAYSGYKTQGLIGALSQLQTYAKTNIVDSINEVDSKINDFVINVKDKRFGAKGDGITDDTEAINNANEYLHSIGGGTLLFPYGTYIVYPSNNYAFKIYSNTRYLGNYAKIKVKDGTNYAGYNFQSVFYTDTWGTSNVIFENLIFDLNGANNLFWSNETIQKCAAIYGYSAVFNFIITKCNFFNCSGGNFIVFGEAYNIWIDKNIFQNCGRSISGNTGIGDHSSIMGTGSYWYISNNVLTNPNKCSVSTGLEIDAPNSVVENNYVENYKIGAIISCNGVTSINNYIFKNNTLISNSIGISMWSSSATVENVIIDGNTIKPYYTDGQYGCIGIDLITYISVGINNISIINNKIYQDLPDIIGNGYNHAIGVGSPTYANDISIENNEIKNFTGCAIYVNGYVNRINIKNNKIDDVCVATYKQDNERAAILLSETSGKYIINADVSNNIVNNNIYNNCVVGFTAWGDIRNIRIDNNVFNTSYGYGISLNNLTLTNVGYINIFHKANYVLSAINSPSSLGSQIVDLTTGKKFIKKKEALVISQWNTEQYENGLNPNGSYIQGDIIYNTFPANGGYIGWAYTGSAWKGFGLIES